jgi:hypothetical protein
MFSPVDAIMRRKFDNNPPILRACQNGKRADGMNENASRQEKNAENEGLPDLKFITRQHETAVPRLKQA